MLQPHSIRAAVTIAIARISIPMPKGAGG
jgi:hypothetical protein